MHSISGIYDIFSIQVNVYLSRRHHINVSLIAFGYAILNYLLGKKNGSPKRSKGAPEDEVERKKTPSRNVTNKNE